MLVSSIATPGGQTPLLQQLAKINVDQKTEKEKKSYLSGDSEVWFNTQEAALQPFQNTEDEESLRDNHIRNPLERTQTAQTDLQQLQCPQAGPETRPPIAALLLLQILLLFYRSKPLSSAQTHRRDVNPATPSGMTPPRAGFFKIKVTLKRLFL